MLEASICRRRSRLGASANLLRGRMKRRQSRSLERGRELYARRAWSEAHAALAAADRESPLAGQDLFMFAMAAALVGEDQSFLRVLERAYRAHLAAGELQAAARTAYWLAMRLQYLG